MNWGKVAHGVGKKNDVSLHFASHSAVKPFMEIQLCSTRFSSTAWLIVHRGLLFCSVLFLHESKSHMEPLSSLWLDSIRCGSLGHGKTQAKPIAVLWNIMLWFFAWKILDYVLCSIATHTSVTLFMETDKLCRFLMRCSLSWHFMENLAHCNDS